VEKNKLRLSLEGAAVQGGLTAISLPETVVPLPQEAEAVPQEALVRGLILMLLQHLFTVEASVTLQEFGL
jgi:hypothetical protein